MPSRGLRNYGLVKQTFANQPTYYQTPLTDGYFQEISALNNVGMWVPGKFRHNSVIIQRKDYETTPGGTAEQTYGDLKKGRITGDIAAALGFPGINTQDLMQPPNVESYAVNAAIAKSKEPDFDLGVVFAELGETIDGIIHPISALRKYVKQLDSKKINSLRTEGRKTVDMLTGSWLEWTYGVMPTVSTIQDAIAEYNRVSLGMVNTLRRSKGSVKFGKSSTMSNLSVGPGYYSITGDVLTSVSKRQSATAFWMLTKPSTWQAQMGIDATFLPSVLWEKVQLSFVLDWFYGVGPWLAAIRPMENRTAIGTSVSLKVSVRQHVHNVRAGLYACPLMSTGSTATCTTQYLKRSLGSTTASYMPVVSPNLLGLKRSISAASLAWQRLPWPKR